MKKQWYVALVGVGMMFAIAMLWSRVRQLEKSVDLLTRQLQSKPKALLLRTAEPAQREKTEKQRIFKLIETAPPNGGTTEIGVPWSVKHGMLIDAVESAAPVPRVENHSPTIIPGPFDINDQTRQELFENLPTEAQSESDTN